MATIIAKQDNPAKHKSLFDVLLMASLFAPSFLFLKIALQEINPITVIALRVTFAGLFLWTILKIRKTSIPMQWNLWKHCFVLGFLLNGLPFVCFSYSLTLIPSSLSALLNGLTPVFTVFLANAFLEDERLNLDRALGVLLGLSGFCVLFLPSLLKNELSFDGLGMFLSFFGAALYGVGAVYARKLLPKAQPLVAPTLQLLTSSIYLIPLAFLFETPYELMDTSLSAWSAVIGVSLFGTALAFIMYHKILSRNGATVLTMATYLLPVFGTILGVVFLNETINSHFLIAALLILSGVGVINGLIPLPFRNRV